MTTIQLIKSLNDSHLKLVFDLLGTMSNTEFNSIPTCCYTSIEKRFIEANGIAIDHVSGERVFSLGGPFFKIKLV